MLKEHLSLTKNKPHLLTSWLTLVAFEDLSEFAELTKIIPEHVLQSLMYRMEAIEQSAHNTDDPKHTRNLEVSDYRNCLVNIFSPRLKKTFLKNVHIEFPLH